MKAKLIETSTGRVLDEVNVTVEKTHARAVNGHIVALSEQLLRFARPLEIKQGNTLVIELEGGIQTPVHVEMGKPEKKEEPQE